MFINVMVLAKYIFMFAFGKRLKFKREGIFLSHFKMKKYCYKYGNCYIEKMVPVGLFINHRSSVIFSLQ